MSALEEYRKYRMASASPLRSRERVLADDAIAELEAELDGINDTHARRIRLLQDDRAKAERRAKEAEAALAKAEKDCQAEIWLAQAKLAAVEENLADCAKTCGGLEYKLAHKRRTK